MRERWSVNERYMNGSTLNGANGKQKKNFFHYSFEQKLMIK